MSLAASTRSETTKVFSTSFWWILAIVAVLYVGGTAVAMAAVFGLTANGTLPADEAMPLPANLAPVIYSLVTSLGYVFPLLIGTLLTTGEFRHRTLTSTFLATPQRGTVLLAKVVVGALVGALFGVIMLVPTVAGSAAVFASTGIDPELGSTDTWLLLGRVLLACVLWALVGVGLGSLLTNQVVAIVVVLAFTQLVEPILRVGGAFLEPLAAVTKYLPGAAGDALVGTTFYEIVGGSAGSGDVTWWGGGLLLAGYAAVLLILGASTSWRRDVT